MLAQVKAPHLTAGIVLHNDVVTEVAPILSYMRGWSRDRVRRYCQTKGWQVSAVNEDSDPPISE